MTPNSPFFQTHADSFEFTLLSARNNDKGGKPDGTPGGGNGGTTDPAVQVGSYTSGATDDGTTDHYNITVNYMGEGWTLEQMNAVAAAVDYISELVVAGLIDDGEIDDLVITVTLTDIDGPGGTVAQGRPTAVRSSDDVTPDGLPVSGEIFIDVADIDAIMAQGTLDDLILHEVLHVMGLGTLWEVPGVRDFLSDPTFVPDLSTRNPNDGDTIITYTGGALDAEGGQPLVETEGSLGHWDEATYGDELMTTVFNISGNYLSQMTVDALADLGYQVDDQVGAQLSGSIDLTANYTADDFGLA